MIVRNLQKCTRFFIQFAFALSLCSCCLCSCSFFSSRSNTSLDLDTLNPEWELYAVGEDNARVYRHQESFDSPLFLTAMKECDVQINFEKHSRSLARQLFVGMKDIRLIGAERENIDGQDIALSRVSGDYSGERLHFAHYMTSKGRCLIDIVTWTKGAEESEQAPEYLYLSQSELNTFIHFIDSEERT